jgi:hypothetical protein
MNSCVLHRDLHQLCCHNGFTSKSCRSEAADHHNLVLAAAAAAEPAAAVQGGKPSLHNQPAPEVYAIVEVAGKQMFVEPGKWYVCNRLQVSFTSHHLCISFQVALSSCS